MTTLLKRVSTLTDKGQTTIPKSVRDALGIAAGDRIVFHVDAERRVMLTREDGEDDPVIIGFLDFLAKDMLMDPARSIQAFPEELKARIERITSNKAPELDDQIEGIVEL